MTPKSSRLTWPQKPLTQWAIIFQLEACDCKVQSTLSGSSLTKVQCFSQEKWEKLLQSRTCSLDLKNIKSSFRSVLVDWMSFLSFYLFSFLSFFNIHTWLSKKEKASERKVWLCTPKGVQPDYLLCWQWRHLANLWAGKLSQHTQFRV